MWIAGLRTFFIQPGIDVENLALARWFIGLSVSVGIGIACFLLYKLFGQWVALAGLASLAFSPLFLAQTRRVHTDALATTFILLMVLLFLIYCRQRPQRRYLLLSGIAFGLSLLSKSYALIFLPWIPFCLFLFRGKYSRNFFLSIVEGLCFLNCTALTCLVLLPVFWTPLFGTLGVCLLVTLIVLAREIKQKTFSVKSPTFWINAIIFASFSLHALQTIWIVFDKVNWALTTPHEVAHFFLGKTAHDPGWLFYTFVLSIKSTPLMLPLALLGCFLLWKNRNCDEMSTQHFQTVLALATGVVLFTVCLSVTSKKFPRYLLPVFPLLEILAAIGLIETLKSIYAVLCARFGPEQTTQYKNSLAVLACIGFFFIQTFPVLALHPYYGTYFNTCWKITDITKIITVGDASGLDIAAKYLNQSPNAEHTPVQVSPVATQILTHYYDGHAYSTQSRIDRKPKYEIVYIRDSQIGLVPQTGTRNGKLEAVITLNGIDHVWIYRITSGQK